MALGGALDADRPWSSTQRRQRLSPPSAARPDQAPRAAVPVQRRRAGDRQARLGRRRCPRDRGFRPRPRLSRPSLAGVRDMCSCSPLNTSDWLGEGLPDGRFSIFCSNRAGCRRPAGQQGSGMRGKLPGLVLNSSIRSSCRPATQPAEHPSARDRHGVNLRGYRPRLRCWVTLGFPASNLG